MRREDFSLEISRITLILQDPISSPTLGHEAPKPPNKISNASTDIFRRLAFSDVLLVGRVHDQLRRTALHNVQRTAFSELTLFLSDRLTEMHDA